ncbi:MAG: argininosuccinate synthase, partial [Nitrososphaerota archaeon]
LYKGNLRVVGRLSPLSLYDKDLANYNIKTSFNQAYAEGFTTLWGLPTTVYGALKKRLEEKQ